MKRGDLFRVRRVAGDPKRSRVVVVVSRPTFVAASFASVICAPVYTERRGVATEVPVGPAEGLKHASAILCDVLTSVPKALLTDCVGMLGTERLVELKRALRIALAIE